MSGALASIFASCCICLPEGGRGRLRGKEVEDIRELEEQQGESVEEAPVLIPGPETLPPQPISAAFGDQIENSIIPSSETTLSPEPTSISASNTEQPKNTTSPNSQTTLPSHPVAEPPKLSQPSTMATTALSTSTPNDLFNTEDGTEISEIWALVKFRVVQLAGGDEKKLKQGISIEEVLKSVEVAQAKDRKAAEKYGVIRNVFSKTLMCIQHVGGIIAGGAAQVCFISDLGGDSRAGELVMG